MNKRTKILLKKAREAAERVRRWEDTVELDPSNAIERTASWYLAETKEQLAPRKVFRLFLATYLAPSVLYIILSLPWWIKAPWTIFLFPSGLFAFLTASKDVVRLSLPGYAIYASVFGAALAWRKHWQTLALWVVLLALIAFNMVGCHVQYQRATADITTSP